MSLATIITTLTSVIGVVVVGVATFYALRQFSESLRARHLQSILGLARQLESRSLRSTRHLLSEHFVEFDKICDDKNRYTELDRFFLGVSDRKMGLNEVRDDLAILEYASLLAIDEMLPDALTVAYLLPTIVDSWSLVHPIVLATRRQMGSEVYLQHLQAMNELAGKRHFPDRKERRRKVKELGTKSLDAVAKRIASGKPAPW
jgi:hypothetical protein